MTSSRFWMAGTFFCMFLYVPLQADAEPCADALSVPHVTEDIIIDGVLNETCYGQWQPLTAFTNVSNRMSPVPATRFWAFWSKDHFILAFECCDPLIAATPPAGREHDVDVQDRVEWFLWSGRAADPYYCFEIAPLGAVHDYKARFYRMFDSAWTPQGFTCKTRLTKTGYCVEASVSREGLAELGFTLEQGQTWRSGLFRADFDRLGGTPTWITWRDAQTKKPDFHVANAFGIFRLE